jgi:hypothetical protein
MKKIILTLAAVVVVSMYSTSMASIMISTDQIRTETRFLTDKMRYELNLDNNQYNDVYEINYDFFYAVRGIMDDVAYGDSWATDSYYEALNRRNDDLRYVLDTYQYEKFINRDYFARPFYSDNGTWGLQVYFNYGPNVYYYSCPTIYSTYFGNHYRNDGYYMSRYNHNIYRSPIRYTNQSAIRNITNIKIKNRNYDGKAHNYGTPYNGSNRRYNSSNTRSYTNPSNSSSNNTRTYSNPSNSSNNNTRTYNNPSNSSNNNTRTYSSPSNSSNNNTRTYNNPSSSSSNNTRSYSRPSNSSNNNTRTYSSPSNSSNNTRTYSAPSSNTRSSNVTRSYSAPATSTPNNQSNVTRSYSAPATPAPSNNQRQSAPAAPSNNSNRR